MPFVVNICGFNSAVVDKHTGVTYDLPYPTQIPVLLPDHFTQKDLSGIAQIIAHTKPQPVYKPAPLSQASTNVVKVDLDVPKPIEPPVPAPKPIVPEPAKTTVYDSMNPNGYSNPFSLDDVVNKLGSLDAERVEIRNNEPKKKPGRPARITQPTEQ